MAEPIRRGTKAPPAAVPANRPRGAAPAEPPVYSQDEPDDQGAGDDQGADPAPPPCPTPAAPAGGVDLAAHALAGPFGLAILIAFLKALLASLGEALALTPEQLDAALAQCRVSK